MVSTILDAYQAADFDGRGSAKFSADHDDGFLEESGGFQIIQQRGNRPVRLESQLAVNQDVVVIVPGLHVSEIDLHHANATLHQTPRQQAPSGEITLSITGAGGFALLAEVESFQGLGLHTVSDLHRLDTRFKLQVGTFRPQI